MDEIEDLLGRYRPVRPPPGLRARVTSQNGSDRARSWIVGWAAVAAVLFCVVLFNALAAREHQRVVIRISPPAAAPARETFEEPWR